MGRPRKEMPNHSSGMYCVRKKIGENFDGTPIRKSFYSSVSKADARLKADDYIARAERGDITLTAPSEIDFATWAEKVLATLVGTVKDSTYNLTFKNTFENHLVPYFNKRKVASIQQIEIQQYFNDKGKVLAAETLKKHKRCLTILFNSAILNGVCTQSPMISIKLKSHIPPAQKTNYTQEQADAILEFAKTHRFGLSIILLIECGLSRSELLGLRWSNFDATAGTLSVEQGVADVQDAVTRKIRVEIGDTKNAHRKRVLPLSPEMVQYLNNHKCDNDYIITNTNGNVCSPRTWSRRHYDVFMADMHEHYLAQGVDIPMLNPHELRHTRASLWVNAGLNLYAIAKYLGHADLEMLQKRYGHSSTDDLRDLLKLK